MPSKYNHKHLKYLLQVQRSVIEDDSFSAPRQTWKDHCKIWCKVTDINGTPVNDTLKCDTKMSYSMLTRFSDKLLTGDRIIYKNKKLIIRSITPDDEGIYMFIFAEIFE